ncbi:hypothetical protein LAUMK191_02048 [Mycobacterium attenuatum]|uniref:Uncharacterized protein n=1 Tax=Mycobacterium attenuatum TaxID=2341086 RepID=A0A498PXG4_9MYCO|nr:hypothetical protein LAUMK136_02050 [Mycobacterium attenuatum]VBA50825.1 hypothetical protein LAUMK191_02048 [Mycobacterium attenuatum]VBA56629.1 hypothetical protein LAUMK41_02135 [Mycobacterium attenuatum]
MGRRGAKVHMADVNTAAAAAVAHESAAAHRITPST